MDHDHSGHNGHSGMPDMPGHSPSPGPTCSMHMLWNTQIINTCIIFPSWHISSTTSFVLSFVVIVFLGILYEHLRCVQQRLDVYIARRIAAKERGKRASSPRSRSGSASPVGVSRADEDREPLLTGRIKVFTSSPGDGTPVPVLYRLLRAVLYGSTVFLSFFLMLVFMTYNAYLILAVVLGAAIGHFRFGGRMNTDVVLGGAGAGKGIACH